MAPNMQLHGDNEAAGRPAVLWKRGERASTCEIKNAHTHTFLSPRTTELQAQRSVGPATGCWLSLLVGIFSEVCEGRESALCGRPKGSGGGFVTDASIPIVRLNCPTFTSQAQGAPPRTAAAAEEAVAAVAIAAASTRGIHGGLRCQRPPGSEIFRSSLDFCLPRTREYTPIFQT